MKPALRIRPHRARRAGHPRWRARASALLTAAALLAAAAPAQAADDPALLTPLSGPAVFLPGGGDAFSASFRLDEASTLTATVKNASGAVIATLVEDRSYPWGDDVVRWYGTTDGGSPAPEGDYTLQISATSSSGRTATQTWATALDARERIRLVEPTPDAEVSGTIRVALRVPPGAANVKTYASSYGQGCCDPTTSPLAPGPDGLWHMTLDADLLPHGQTQISGHAEWTDRLGGVHWATESTSVFVRRAPVYHLFGEERTFTPDGDGHNDAYSVGAYLDAPAKVTARIVRPGTGDVPEERIRTLVEAEDTRNGWTGLWWDGTLPDGSPAPAGRYELQVETVDDRGATEETSQRLAIERGPFVTVSAPTEGATFDEEIGVVVRAKPDVELRSISAGIERCWSSCWASQSEPLDDGSFRLTADARSAYEGENALTVIAYHRDAFGADQPSAVRIPIVIDHPDPPPPDPSVWFSPGPRVFTPDGDGYDDSWGTQGIPYNVTRLSIVVLDGTGRTVRTVREPSAPDGQGWWQWWGWDGRLEDGTVAPDGDYTVRFRAEGADGTTPLVHDETATVDTAPVATLVSPTAGSTHTDTVPVRVRPALGRQVQGVTAYLVNDAGSASWSGWSGVPEIDGTYATDAAIPYRFGLAGMIADVRWIDDYGQTHDSRLRADVTGTRHLAPGSVAQTCPMFTPDGDGFDDGCSVDVHTSSEPAALRVEVIDADGKAVAVLEGGRPTDGDWVSHWLGWDGRGSDGEVVPDGAYRIRTTVSPDDGSTPGVVISDPFTVDTRRIATMEQPGNGDRVGGRARVVVAPIEGFAIESTRIFIDGYDFGAIHAPSPDGRWKTTVDIGWLPDGEHQLTVDVRANHDGQTLVRRLGRTLDVDRSRPSLLATLTPDAGQAPIDSVMRIDASDREGGDLRYTVDYGDDTPPVDGTITEPYAPREITHTYTQPGTYTARVTVEDPQGHAAQQALRVVIAAPPNAAPVPTLTADTTRGAAPLTSTFRVAATDADGDELTYRLDFGDGASGSTGDLPRADTIEHTYRRAGTYFARLRVSDGRVTSTARLRIVAVLGEPLAARPGDEVVVGEGQPVTLDGGDSRPLGAIERFKWDLGDGTTAEGSRVEHTYAKPGTYTVRLTAQAAGSSASATTTVTVVPDTSPRLDVLTKDPSGSPLGGVDIVVVTAEGKRHAAVTGSDGRVRLDGLPDGAHTVFAYLPGRRPAAKPVTIADGRGSAELTLQEGAAVKTELTSRPMTLAEIRAAGIDTEDPANRHVFQFEVHLEFNADPVGLPSSGGGGSGGGGGGTVGVLGRAGALWLRAPSGEAVPCEAPCRVAVPGGIVGIGIGGTASTPTLSALVIPIRESFLKAFFEVQLAVLNLGDPGFTLKDAVASLPLPSGLSLAPTARGEHAEQRLPDIPGGEQRAVTWVLRGDVEGSYDLEASFAAMLDPVDEPVSVHAQTPTPLKVWGGSALKTIIEVDSTISSGHPYHVRVGLENVADVPVNSAAVELLRDGRVGYVEQPREQMTRRIDVIAPKATWWTDGWVLVPSRATGRLDMSRSFVKRTAGDVVTATEIRPKDRTPSIEDDPRFEVRRHRGGLVVEWDDAPGARGQDFFTQPSVDDDFVEPPLPSVPIRGAARKRFFPNAPNGDKVRLAMSTRFADRREMVHPALFPDAGNVEPSIGIHRISTCNTKPWQAAFTLSDELGLGGWRWRESGGSWSPWTLLHGETDYRETLPWTDADTVEVQTFSDPSVTGFPGSANIDADPTATIMNHSLGGCDYVALGDSYSSGEGAGAYDANTATATNGCHRSKNAFARILAKDPELKLTLKRFVACSGATSNFLDEPNSKNSGEPPQLNALSDPPDIVTITMGGNDVHFPHIVETCAGLGLASEILAKRIWPLNEAIPGCATARHVSYITERNDLKPKLIDLYKRIRNLPAGRTGPNPRLLVLGYPHLFPSFDWLSCTAFTSADVRWMHWATQDFNQMLADAAEEARAEFVPSDEQFGSHDVCQGEGTRWFNKPLDTNDWVEWFHPDAYGHEQWASVVASFLKKEPLETVPLTPGETIIRTLPVTTKLGQKLLSRVEWPGSTVGLALVSPSGRRITTDTVAPDVQADRTPTSAAITVTDPEAGTWKTEVTGVDVDPKGEPVSLRTFTADAPPAGPVALGFADRRAGVAPATIAFDGSQSFVPGSSVTIRRWDFGDGARAEGAKVTHTYTAPGRYAPTLTVRSANGQEDTLKLDPITITGPSPAGGGAGSPPAAPPPEPTPGREVTGGTSGAAAPEILPSTRPRPPAMTLKTLSGTTTVAALRRGIVLKLTVPAAGVQVRATLARKGSKHALGKAALTSRGSGNATLKLKIATRALRGIRRGTRLTLRVTATGGQVTPVTTTVQMRVR